MQKSTQAKTVLNLVDVKPQSRVLADPLNSEQIQLFFNESGFFTQLIGQSRFFGF